MMGILDGRPVLLTLPVMLHTYVEHRENVIEEGQILIWKRQNQGLISWKD